MGKKFNLLKKISKIIYKKRLVALKNKITSKDYNNLLNNNDDINIKENIPFDKIESIILKYSNNPDKLLEFIKGANTPIYKIKNAQSFLSKINEEQGFIIPQKGFKALYLNLFLNHKFSFEINETFIIDRNDYSNYLFCYQFYRWYCYKTKIKGYEEKNLKLFKNVFELTKPEKIDSLTMDEIIQLKDSIKRDIEAIDFVKKLSIKTSQSKKTLEKIKLGKKVQI